MVTPEEIEKLKKRDAFAQKSLAGINGLTGIVANTGNLMRIGNTSQYDNAIDSLNNIGRNYNTYDQIAQGYGDIVAMQPNLDYDTIRGMNGREQFGNILSSTATGAVTGAQIGGPWGGVIGGAVGLGAGLLGKFTGDENAESKQDALRLNALVATNHATQGLNSSSEYIADQTHRQRIANLNSKGGQIKKMLTAKEFADKVLGRQKERPVTNSSGIVIKKCDGGTMIRIKR